MALNLQALTGEKDIVPKKGKDRTIPQIDIESSRDSKGFFSPSERGVRIRDVLRELPGATLKVAKDILRAPGRAAATLELEQSGRQELVPETIPEKILFGKEPIRNIRGTGSEFLQSFGVKPETASTLGVPVGFALTALDIYPGSSGKRKAFSESAEVVTKLAKSKSVREINNILKAEVPQLSKEVRSRLSKEFKNVSAPADIATRLNRELPSLPRPIKDSKGKTEFPTPAKPSLAEEALRVAKQETPSPIKKPEVPARLATAEEQSLERTARELGGEDVLKTVGEVSAKKPEIPPLLGTRDAQLADIAAREAEVAKGTPLGEIRGEQVPVRSADELSRSRAALEEKSIRLQNLKEQIAANPARTLGKYINKKEGVLPEVTGKRGSIFSQKGDDIVTELGFRDSEQARQAYLAYRDLRKEAKALADEIRTDRRALREATQVTKLLDRQAARDVAREPQTTKTRRVMDENFYAENREFVKDKTNSVYKRIVSSFDNITREIKASDHPIANLFQPISTRLKKINPEFKRKLRNEFEFPIGQRILKAEAVAVPFLKGLKKIRESSLDDFIDLDLAFKNSDIDKIDEVVKKHGVEKEYIEVRKILNELWDEATNAGYKVNFVKDYFPRSIKDKKGLIQFVPNSESWIVYRQEIEAESLRTQKVLNIDEQADVINSLLRGFRKGKITLSERGALKSREILQVTPEINKFYNGASDSLLNYFREISENIELAKFFGKTDKERPIEDLQGSIGAKIVQLIANNKLGVDEAVELRDLLQARANEKGTKGIFNLYKNFAYADTMGSFTSAITQLGDLALAIYRAPREVLPSFVRAVVKKSDITREDIGLSNIAEEFKDSSTSAKILSKIFKFTGLEQIDTIGKETFMNAVIAKYRRLAKNPTPDFTKRLEAHFGDDIEGVLQDLRQGNKTENVRLLAFNELADVQPILLSEMPRQYLVAGNGRLFYMLKSWTLKQLDNFRNEVFETMKTDKKEGIKRMVQLGGALFLMNATADEIKDFLLGRETSLSDRVVDNVAKVAGLNRYITNKIRTQGLATALKEQILPPSKFIDALSKDVANFMKGESKKGLETPDSIPLLGKLYYWRFGRGAEKQKTKQKSGLELPSVDLGGDGATLPKIDIDI